MLLLFITIYPPNAVNSISRGPLISTSPRSTHMLSLTVQSSSMSHLNYLGNHGFNFLIFCLFGSYQLQSIFDFFNLISFLKIQIWLYESFAKNLTWLFIFFFPKIKSKFLSMVSGKFSKTWLFAFLILSFLFPQCTKHWVYRTMKLLSVISTLGRVWSFCQRTCSHPYLFISHTDKILELYTQYLL